MTPHLTIAARFAHLAAALDDAGERGMLEAQFPDYLRGQRWFGGQTRRLVATRLRRWVPLPPPAPDACLCVVAATDSDGSTTDHLVFLAAGAPGGNHRPVYDALEHADARAALLRLALGGDTIAGWEAEFVGEPTGVLAAGDYGAGRLVGVEQSNSSVVFGDACILKLYRRLAPGRNPDVELGHYLTTEACFAATPQLVASARLRGPDGYDADALLVQTFVASEGDGWAWAVAAAGRAFAAVTTRGGVRDWLVTEQETLAAAATLGRMTAQLHAALAAATGPALRPEAATADDGAEWVAALRREADDATSALRRSGITDPALVAALARAATFAEPPPRDLGAKMRIHGDYHLGQVLKTGTHFVVLDFEGEPARSLDERRARQHPLVDVAGMLRSWGYAAHAAARAGENQAPSSRPSPADLAATWEAATGGAFLDAYWTAADAARPAFLPADGTSRGRLLRLFELRKALYEVRYELNNRPDWVAIPARAILAGEEWRTADDDVGREEGVGEPPLVTRRSALDGGSPE